MPLALAPQRVAALEVPPLERRVVDRAEVLSPAARERLERELAAFERETSHQIVVHTTPSLEGLPIEEYSIRVAEAWKVGHASLDNGLILTVAPNERKVRIEVGYGLEGIVPDAIASRVVRETILPAFRRGDLEAGIQAGVAQLERVAAGEEIPAAERPAGPARGERERSSRGGYPVWVWLFVLLVFGLRGFFFLPFLGGMGMGRRGGFGGGGGFSGGGGGFGGGGASGSW